MSRPPLRFPDLDEPPLPYTFKSARRPYYPPSLPSRCVHLVPPSPATGPQPADGQSAAEPRPQQLQIQIQPPQPQPPQPQPLQPQPLQKQQRMQSTSPTARLPRPVDQQHPMPVFYAAAAAANYQEYPRSPQSEASYAPPPPLPPPPPSAHPFRHQEEYLLSAAAQTSPRGPSAPPSLPCAAYEYPGPWRGTIPPDQQATIAGSAVAGSQQHQKQQLQQQSSVAVSSLVHHWPWHADMGPPPPPELLGFQYPAVPPPSTAHQYAAVAVAASGLARPRYLLPRPPFYSPIQDDAGASIQIVLQKQTGDITSIFEGGNHRLMIYEGFAYDVLLTWKPWSLLQTTGAGIYSRIYYAAVGHNAPMYDLFMSKWFHWQDWSAGGQHYPTWCRCYSYVLDLSKASSPALAGSSRGEPRPDDLRPESGELPVVTPAYYRIEFGTADSREDAFAKVSKSKIPVVYREFIVHSKRTAYHHCKKRRYNVDQHPSAAAAAAAAPAPQGAEERATPKAQLPPAAAAE